MNAPTPQPAPGQITARLIPQNERLNTLPRHFGRHMVRFEMRVYDLMDTFAKEYRGGFWNFYDLSNGGFYMAPAIETLSLSIPNGFEGRMSGDAAGIVVCLFAYSFLSFDYPIAVFGDHFHWLRAFALDHKESRMIFQAID